MPDREAVAAIRAMVAEAPNSAWVVDPPVLTDVLAALDAMADMVRVSNERLLAIQALCDKPWHDDGIPTHWNCRSGTSSTGRARDRHQGDARAGAGRPHRGRRHAQRRAGAGPDGRAHQRGC